MIKSEYLDMSEILKTSNINKLFSAVEEHGGTIRFVGGAVRDSLAGKSGFELDLATNLSPDELVEACQDNGLRTMPIGLKSGAIGVLLDNHILEVSSLRKPIKTSARREELVFTDDWSADASARDLTINAVYADLRGNVFDYYNGINDLENGVIRFIGKPEDRIKEDYLRIIRFFRFYSIFGKTDIDKDALKACVKLKDGLRTVPIERVRDELFKLLVTPRVAETMKIIFDNDILSYFLPKPKHFNSLDRLAKLVENMNYKSNFLRRLFVMYQPNSAQANDIAGTLRFTKKQKENFTKWAKIELTLHNMLSARMRKQFVYRYGKEFCVDKILLTVAIHNVDTSHLSDVLNEVNDMVMPIFPIRGRDIINQGIKADENVGKILASLEQQWIDSDFSLTRNELLNMVKISS